MWLLILPGYRPLARSHRVGIYDQRPRKLPGQRQIVSAKDPGKASDQTVGGVSAVPEISLDFQIELGPGLN